MKVVVKSTTCADSERSLRYLAERYGTIVLVGWGQLKALMQPAPVLNFSGSILGCYPTSYPVTIGRGCESRLAQPATLHGGPDGD